MGDLVTVARMREDYPKAYRSWSKISDTAKRFVLKEVGEDRSEVNILEAIKKWKKQQRKK